MTSNSKESVTQLLQQLNAGQSQAAEELLPLIYQELHRVAQSHMNQQRPGHTLQATALVNEAFVRMFRSPDPHWRDRDHFLALAAKAMRCVLIDHARGKNRDKRKVTFESVPLDELAQTFAVRAHDLIGLDEALERMAKIDPKLVKVIELRFFGGLSVKDTARILGVSERTVERDWKAGRAWLRKEMG